MTLTLRKIKLRTRSNKKTIKFNIKDVERSADGRKIHDNVLSLLFVKTM